MTRRIRAQRALNGAVQFGLAGLGTAACVLVLVKVGTLAPGTARTWLGVAGTLPGLGAVLGALRPVPPLLAAQLLDRAYGLRSRLATAVELAGVDPQDRTPFMKAAIDDATAHASGLRARRAMPLRTPRGLSPTLGVAVGVGLLASLEVPERVPVHRPAPAPPALLHPDELGAFQSEAEDILARSQAADAKVKKITQQYNDLLEQLADRELDRAEALTRIRDLEQRLAQAGKTRSKALRNALAQLGKDLEGPEDLRKASEALKEHDARRATQEIDELADKMRSEQLDRRELEQLRQALKRAAKRDEDQKKRAEHLRRKRKRLRRLLQRQREKQDQEPSARRERLLKRRERKLERLRREQRKLEEQRRRLERLRREWKRSAERLQRNQQKQAADDMQRGARDLRRMARQQLTREQRERLKQQLRQLREMIRRQRRQRGQSSHKNRKQGQGQGQGRRQQMDRFVLRARGQQDGEGTPLVMPSKGQKGQGQQGQGQQGKGQQGQGQGRGQGGARQGGQGGQQGQRGGKGQGEGERALTLGGKGQPNARLEIPGMGKSRGGGSGAQRRGRGGGRAGSRAGTEHDPRKLDEPTDIDSSKRNVRLQGKRGDKGPTRSESIRSSADRGFVSRGYKKVYTDYRGHAEEVLEEDEVPPGYRFYVRRYFQLIRPREEP